jgi:uncharacterized RmlC-like cupin family protein
MKTSSLVAGLAILLGSFAAHAQAPAPASAPAAAGAVPPAPAAHTALSAADLKWGDVPPMLPKGAKLAVLYGDPSKTGLFVARIKMPAGYKVMPHWHPTDEQVTVLSGALAIGMGDKLDPKAKAQGPGGFYSMPANMHHFAVASKETVIELTAMAPFTLTYIDPNDDPSKAAAPPAPKK